MANYSTLKAAVADVVKTNGTQAITGANLQTVLLSIINSVGGGGYIFKGVATPSTDAGTPDENMFYVGGAGTYANFGSSITIPVGSIGVFKYNGSWTREQIEIVSKKTFSDISDLNEAVFTNEDGLITLSSADSESDWELKAGYLGMQAGWAEYSQYNSYWFIIDTNAQLYVTSNGTYTQLSVYPSGEFGDPNFVRYRTTDNNLPTPSNMLSVTAGTMLILSTNTTANCSLSYTGTIKNSRIENLVNHVTYLNDEIEDIAGDPQIVPDVYTFGGVNGKITFDKISIKDNGDAIEFDVQTTIADAAKGFAFMMQSGVRSICVKNDVISLMDALTSSWITGYNGSNGTYNFNQNLYTALDIIGKIRIYIENGSLKVTIKGLSLPSVSNFNGSIDIDTIGGSYSGNYWNGTLSNFKYTHDGKTWQLHELAGYSVSGDVTYTTKTETSQLEKFENIVLETATEQVETNIDDITGVVFESGRNGSPNGEHFYSMTSLSGYDSWYFYLEKDTALWLSSSAAYAAIGWVEKAKFPTTGTNIYIEGYAVGRKRKSENNMPTKDNPIVLSAGDAVIITLTAGATATIYSTQPAYTLNGDLPLAPQHIQQVQELISASNYLTYSSGEMDVYIKIGQGFIKYVFVHAITSSINCDVWRVSYAAYCDDSGAETKQLTTAGEWEAAIHLVDRPDFSGGAAHGDEVYTSIKFFADGVPLDVSSSITRLSFDELVILQTSTMYDPLDSTTQIATHTSEHIFNKDGLKIDQSLIWLVNAQLTSSYMAMFPVAKTVTDTYCTDKNFTPTSISTSNRFDGVKKLNIWAETAKVFCVFGIGEYRGLSANQIESFITDNGGGAYNKCYYVIATNGDSASVGDIWKTETYYKIMAGN